MALDRASVSKFRTGKSTLINMLTGIDRSNRRCCKNSPTENRTARLPSLFLFEGMARDYVSTIMGKLHVNDRTQTVILALERGLARLA